MSKIRIKTVLKTNDDNLILNTKGILKDNELVYVDNSIKTKLNLDQNILIRENDDYQITIDFDNKKLSYYLKEYDKNIEDKIKINSIIKKDKYFKVNYLLNDVTYDYELSYEVEV